jgi:5-methylcytosine-specific restriction protein A
MSRKQFIESQGATCKNWTWSWSFVNEAEKFIIFGAWDVYDDGNMTLILSEDWEISRKGSRQRGYPQSREHIRLIEEEGYKLKTFPMEYEAAGEEEGAPAKIKGFTQNLSDKKLIRIDNSWYASDQTYGTRLPEEVDPKEVFKEGASKIVTVNQYERSAVARAKCLAHHGYKCAVCSFDFEKTYGEIGKNYIHVHHIIPISEIGKEYELNPVSDLVPVCPNCHAMIHITRPALSIKQLRKAIESRT